MWVHLFTKGPMPPRYIDVLLCERFGTGVLDLPADEVMEYLVCWQVETSVGNFEAKLKARKGSGEDD